MRIIDRLDKFIVYNNLNDRQFSVSCNLSMGLLSKARHKNCDISKKSVEKILNHYKELNRTWLITGVGSMINEEYHE
ncbi:MAG: hypothetical protein R3Y51_03975 [Rikenellaceae bacterium]